MASFKRFEDIEAWKSGHVLIRKIYQVTSKNNFRKDYALRDQIRRAAISITANNAEGFERDSNKEFIYFLSIAKGSAGEVRDLLYTALDLAYLNQEEFNAIFKLAIKTIELISGLSRYLKNSSYKGIRKK